VTKSATLVSPRFILKVLLRPGRGGVKPASRSFNDQIFVKKFSLINTLLFFMLLKANTSIRKRVGQLVVLGVLFLKTL